jgi:Histidine kinase-, DNA gyrase B-, and HSP90-like ATPase
MTTPQPIKPFFGGFILETLTVGMYGESRNAIREYIQNGFDSIERAVEQELIRSEQGLIEIKLAEDQGSLIIKDNGTGLSSRSAVDTLTRVGASTKDYTSDAGFRGIGRLAGIVFSNRVTFRTKARSESEETTVIFKGDIMREAMTPAEGSTRSAEELIQDSVEAFVATSTDIEDHFFEVKLEGFVDSPEECRNFNLLEEFVSQVAPVPYSQKFPFREKLKAAATKCGLPIEEVNITIKDADKDPVMITKRYEDKYKIESGLVELVDCETQVDGNRNWWAWIGKKLESGAYSDPRVSGLRMRMKNIQIDGTEVVREIFQRLAPSYIRFQDWFVGEIFVRPSFLVPNARRDGFEETAAWKAMRKDLGTLIKGLGKESYDVSNRGQLTVASLQTKLTEKEGEIENLRRMNYSNIDRALAFSAEITKLQKKIAKAAKNADLETMAELDALGSELADFKAEAISKIGASVATSDDSEKVQQDTRLELLKELINLFESELSAPCAVAVRNLLRKEYGDF